MNDLQKKTLEMLLSTYPAGPELIVPHGRLPEHLRAEVQSSNEVKFLVAGQRGMGKTTELRRLVDLLRGTEILPVFVRFGAQQAISQPMLLDAMARALAESLPEKPERDLGKVLRKFQDWFSDDEEVSIDEEGKDGAASVGGTLPILKAHTGISHSRRTTHTKRTKRRPLLGDLIERFNSLVQETRTATKKRVAFVVDDIDKIQDPVSIQDTFIHASHLINEIAAPCIFTVPITYATSSLIRSKYSPT